MSGEEGIQGTIEKWKKRAAGAFLFFLCLNIPMYTRAYASTEEMVEDGDNGKQLVRVGCVDIDNFLIADSSGEVRGYAAEYLDKLAEYTDWRYEFVRGSWLDCLDWLEEGKIDLLLPAEYSAERAGKFLFSDEKCCMDYAALVSRSEDERYYYEDYKSYEGMKVGLIDGNYLNDLFHDFAAAKGFSAQEIYYPSGEAQNQALEKGEVDAIVCGNMNFYSSQKLLAKIDYMPAYFIISMDRPELMEQLNRAQSELALDSPYYSARLYDKYYGKIERQVEGFTRREAEYIKQTGSIKVLYDTDNYPLEYWDGESGQARGIYPDILRLVAEECGLELEIIPNTGDGNPLELLKDGTVDVLLNAYNMIDSGQNDQIMITDEYYSDSYCLVGLRGNKLVLDHQLKAAVLGDREGARSILQGMHPDWQMIDCTSVEECLKSVKKGYADIAFVDTLTFQFQQVNSMTGDLMALNVDSVTVPVCLGVRKEDAGLLRNVLNKGIKKLEEGQINQCVFTNLLSQPVKMSLSRLLHVYPIYTLLACVILVSLAAAGAVLYLNFRAGKKQNWLLQEKNRQLEDAIELQHRLQLENEQDPLTGLKNKKVMRQRCRDALQQAGNQSCALMIVDIDDFKKVNDTYGHWAGDLTIKAVGEYLKEIFAGRLVGRIGGDEFLVMEAPAGNREQLEAELEEFCLSLESGEKLRTPVSCSIGAAFSGQDADTYEAVFKKADEALYKAKNNGKNQYVIL